MKTRELMLKEQFCVLHHFPCLVIVILIEIFCRGKQHKNIEGVKALFTLGCFVITLIFGANKGDALLYNYLVFNCICTNSIFIPMTW